MKSTVLGNCQESQQRKNRHKNALKMNLIVGYLVYPRQDAAIYPFRGRLRGKVIAWADPEVKSTEVLYSSSCPCCLETGYSGGGKKSLSKIYYSSKVPRIYIY
jgi:hypothetical protein